MRCRALCFLLACCVALAACRSAPKKTAGRGSHSVNDTRTGSVAVSGYDAEPKSEAAPQAPPPSAQSTSSPPAAVAGVDAKPAARADNKSPVPGESNPGGGDSTQAGTKPSMEQPGVASAPARPGAAGAIGKNSPSLSLTEPGDSRHTVRNKENRASLLTNILHFVEALSLEPRVSDCQHFIHQQYFRFQMGGDGESESQIHSA